MAGNGLENPRGWWYSMVIQLMTILGPLKVFHGHPDGCPECGIQHKCRHSGLPWPTLAYTGLQWPIVAPPPGPLLLAKTDRSSPPLYTMHYLTTF